MSFALVGVLSIGMSNSRSETLEITENTTLDPAKTYGRIVIKKSNVTIDGKGAWLIGDTTAKSNKLTGIAIEAKGVSNVTIRNVNAKGWETALKVSDGKGWLVEGCNFSDNFHDPEFGWGETPRRGGIVFIEVNGSTIRKCKANNVWDACALVRSDDNTIADNDFSHTSNTCLKMWTACRNLVKNNKLDYGIRKKPNEVHARDSTSVLLESGSNDNRLIENSITNGGDGIFIRSLNQWVSTGNRFEKNDCSYANNNCVECWSPGNIFIGNKANHGSYGFWMGGSNKSVLIDNEASFNGLAKGNHNSPHLPQNGHAGIVFMFGTSSHIIARGNKCVGNNGAGIAVIGDLDSKGTKWKARHWIIEQNTLSENRWGIYVQYADWIQIAANTFEKNSAKDVFLVGGNTNIFELANDPQIKSAPKAKLKAPARLAVGEKGPFDAAGSEDPAGHALKFRWDLGDGTIAEKSTVEHSFAQPGFYRVGLTVTNGSLSDLAWVDLYVTSSEKELGTEGEASQWTWEDPQSKVQFTDDAGIKLQGKSSLLATIKPYSGGRCNLIYRIPNKEGIALEGKKQLTFWIRSENDNIPSWQNPNPIITLRDGDKKFRMLTPQHDPLLKLADSEAREGWLRVVVPLGGDKDWKLEGDKIDKIQSISFGFDSWGGDPLRIWLDGLQIE